jgi:hypothetical protein
MEWISFAAKAAVFVATPIIVLFLIGIFFVYFHLFVAYLAYSFVLALYTLRDHDLFMRRVKFLKGTLDNDAGTVYACYQAEIEKRDNRYKAIQQELIDLQTLKSTGDISESAYYAKVEIINPDRAVKIPVVEAVPMKMEPDLVDQPEIISLSTARRLSKEELVQRSRKRISKLHDLS